MRINLLRLGTFQVEYTQRRYEMTNILHFSDYTPRVKVFTPEMGDRKPVCKMEARLCHYGKHYYIDTNIAIKGRGYRISGNVCG